MKFQEGQTRSYRTAEAAAKAHARAVARGFYYSAVWCFLPNLYRLHVTARNTVSLGGTRTPKTTKFA